MENSLNSHGSEQNEDDDSNNDNFSSIDDEYEDFVVMCPACGQAFSTESGRLQHDFDNCTQPESDNNKTIKSDSVSSENNDSDAMQEEFTDDVMSLQSEYGKLYNGTNQLVEYDDINNSNRINLFKTKESKPHFQQAPLIPLLPKPANSIKFCNNGTSFFIRKPGPDDNKFMKNYFHFKKNEIQTKGKHAIDNEGKVIKVENSEIDSQHKKLFAKTFDCDECGRVFVNLQGLSHHKVTHNGSKPYACACGRSYTTVGNLKAHQKTHSGIKPYSCEQCSKTFTTKQGLIYHRTLHTGMTPFKCEECGKEYAYGVALNAHKKTHARLKREAAAAAMAAGYSMASQQLLQDNQEELLMS